MAPWAALGLTGTLALPGDKEEEDKGVRLEREV